MRPTVDRRQFLGTSAATFLAAQTLLSGSSCTAAQRSDQAVSFFFVSDTHFLANAQAPEQIDEASLAICSSLVDRLNELPGTEIPTEAGGGVVANPACVIHGGDIVDTADKTGPLHERMQQTEWDHYVEQYGLNGTDGRLKFPVYEVHGNHDGPRADTLVTDALADRNRSRAGVSVSDSGLQMAWTVGSVRFINLGIVVGDAGGSEQRRRYSPKQSYEFLMDELQASDNVGRRFVLTHHIDILRYSRECQPDDPANLNMEWHPCDVAAYYDAIKQADVAAILFGHTHARSIQRWNGSSQAAEQGLPIFNTDNASHFASDAQAGFYFEIAGDSMQVREFATRDRWQSVQWTPQTWRFDRQA